MSGGGMSDQEELLEENAKLKAQLAELHHKREQDRAELETKVASERTKGQTFAEAAALRTAELETMKKSVVRLTRQLDEEVTRRAAVEAESQLLGRKVQDLGCQEVIPHISKRSSTLDDDEQAQKERGSQASAKLMRVVDQWMRQRDLQQALLRGAAINDQAFGTLVQALSDCPSLHTLDLSQNLLTMDSCSDLCQLITTAPQLSFVSLAGNLFSLRSLGYFMTAVMERQNTKKLMPLDLLDLQGNEGLVAAASASPPEVLMRQVNTSLAREGTRLPTQGPELVAQVMRALWRFLHDTGHPQVKNLATDEVAFVHMDKVTVRKMENALMKILLLGADNTQDDSIRPVTANFAIWCHLEGYMPEEEPGPVLVLEPHHTRSHPTNMPNARSVQEAHAQPARQLRPELRDPYADLKAAFEPPKEKLKTFNLKQIVTRNGTVLMNMLERLLETTEIDAYDMESEQTLLEYACNTGNMGLAKLCYRRGAKLMARTRKGDTPFNIVTRNRRYDLMEFLWTYGVNVNSNDSKGVTALHCAAENNDCDGICRLISWGADVNARDKALRTPIHYSCAAGHMKATLLLLEVGADMFVIDEKHFNAPRHAELNSHFALFDKLVALGDKPQSPHILMRQESEKQLPEMTMTSSKGMMSKSSSLSKLGKSLIMDAKKKPLWLEAESSGPAGKVVGKKR